MNLCARIESAFQPMDNATTARTARMAQMKKTVVSVDQQVALIFPIPPVLLHCTP